MIPDYAKALDEKILKATDKYLLSSLGLIELKGFSTTREEAILNPKVLIEEVEDGVLDYVELLDDIFYEFREKNKKEHPTLTNNSIRISPEIIKSFITDEMRTMIRSWYDRGLIAKQDAVENTTPLNFETQVNRRDKEKKDRLNFRMYPPVTQNLEKDFNDPSEPKPVNEDIPDDKKPNTPESDNYNNACEEIERINEPMKTIRSIPNEIRQHMSKDEQRIFKEAFNFAFENATELQMDIALRETTALEYAYKKYKEYIQAPYTKENYPDQIKNLPSGARAIWINTFNAVYRETKDEDQARKAAWSNVKKKYKKVKDKWVKK
jgi:cation transport regulator